MDAVNSSYVFCHLASTLESVYVDDKTKKHFLES